MNKYNAAQKWLTKEDASNLAALFDRSVEIMTAESAIKELKRMKMDMAHTGAEYNAIALAIKALEKVEVWNGMGGKQVVAPKGTFEAIYNEEGEE